VIKRYQQKLKISYMTEGVLPTGCVVLSGDRTARVRAVSGIPVGRPVIFFFRGVVIIVGAAWR
jgi:hypothetical protein